jgi:hypothetical protein
MGKAHAQNTAAHMFRLDLKDCCTCVPPRPEISLHIRLLDWCTAWKPMRKKISCSTVYSKPQNSIWIKGYAVSTDGPFWPTVWSISYGTQLTSRAYCKLGIEIGHEHVRTVRHVEFKVQKYLVRYVTDVWSPYCSSVVNGRKRRNTGWNE